LISEKNEVKQTVFSEWEDCDCNECEHYWDSSCDGVAKGTKKPCGQFSATRSVIIPEQIKRLTKVVKWISAYLIFEAVVGIILTVVKLLG
jgi:hypothetical protein